MSQEQRFSGDNAAEAGSEALSAGEEELREGLSILKGQVEGHQESFFQGLQTAVTEPMRAAFREAADTHRRLMLEAGLDREESREPGERDLDWTKLRHYREGVEDEVIEPLQEALGRLEVGREVAQRWQGFLNGLPRTAQGIPNEVVRPEPEDLFARRVGDGLWTAARKAWVRTLRKTQDVLRSAARGLGRILGRSSESPTPREQVVPLESLARGCLLEHCPLTLEPFSEALQQYYAVPASSLASGVARWAREWFPAEEACHGPQDHLPPEIRDSLEASLRAIPDPDPGPGKEIPENQGTPDEPPPDSEGPKPDAVAAALQGFLDAGADLEGPRRAWSRIRLAMEGEWEHLLEEVRVAGTFQRAHRGWTSASRMGQLEARIQARAALWTEWHPANLRRLTLVLSLLRVREGWDRAEDQLLGPLAQEALLPVVGPWTRTAEELHNLEAEAEARMGQEQVQGNLKEAAHLVSSFMERAQALLEKQFAEPVTAALSHQEVSQRADTVVGILSETLRATPDLLVMSPAQPEADRVDPELEPRKVILRENLLKVVDVVRLESLRSIARPFLGVMERAVEESREVPEIAIFNLSSARDELLEAPESTSWPETLDGARNLVMEGLGRTADAIEGHMAAIPASWEELTLGAHGFFSDTFQELHRRTLVEGFVQEQILDFRSRLESRIRRGVDMVSDLGRKATLATSRGFRRLWVRATRVARMGRSAVGIGPRSAVEAQRAMELLRTSPALLDSLPLVYRRLFTFRPVSDPPLLAGREEDADWVNRQFVSWKEGSGVPGLLMGAVGSGLTSLLNVLEQTLFREASVLRLDLDFRPRTEEEFTRWLAEQCELDDHRSGSLRALEEDLSRTPGANPPRVIIMEHLEHLLLKAPGGTELLEDLLTFQARTNRSQLWISTITESAWRYVLKAKPAAATLVSTHSLPLPSRTVMEGLILTRHQRSGLNLDFVEPSDLNPLVRRKLRRTRGEKKKQAILKGEFFDRIHRLSEGSMAMAILLWLHALDFKSREGQVRVNPPRSVRFTFLEELELAQDFALMAFMEHGSLTLSEYADVFLASTEEAWQVFESLRARMLLEPSSRESSLPKAVESIQGEVRYRIPPILGQVVAQRLRNRNILH